MNTRSQSKWASSALNSASASASTTTAVRPVISGGGDAETIPGPKIEVVSWLRLLLNPVLKAQVLGNPESGFKNLVSLDPNDVESSAPPELLAKSGYILGDHIKLSIVYADTTLKWYFSFCWLNPTLPPDMDFNDLEFQPPYMDYEEYYNWDPHTSVDCFKNLLRRLFEDFKKYQRQFCEKQDRLAFELSMLKEAGIDDKSFDVYTHKEGGRKGDVVFIFPIASESVNDLPECFLTEDAVSEKAELKIRFTSFGEGRAHADLELPLFYDKLFSQKTLKLPAMSCLMSEYVTEIRNIIDQEVSVIGDSFKLRREVIMGLIAACPKGSLIDYCQTNFASISFLLDHLDFKYACKIIFNPKFPVTLPQGSAKICFSSIYHESKGSTTTTRAAVKKGSELFTNESTVPGINSRSTPDEIIRKIRDLIDDKIGDFKRQSCQTGA